MTHICVGKLTIIGSNNGLSPGRCQAIIWTNAGTLFNWTLRNKLQWNFNRNSYIFIQENTFENVIRKMTAILSRGRWVKCACNYQPISFCCGLGSPLLSGYISAGYHGVISAGERWWKWIPQIDGWLIRILRYGGEFTIHNYSDDVQCARCCISVDNLVLDLCKMCHSYVEMKMVNFDHCQCMLSLNGYYYLHGFGEILQPVSHHSHHSNTEEMS